VVCPPCDPKVERSSRPCRGGPMSRIDLISVTHGAEASSIVEFPGQRRPSANRAAPGPYFSRRGHLQTAMRKVESIERVRLKRETARQNLGFSSRPFVLCGLPVRRPAAGSLLHERRNGHFILQVTDSGGSAEVGVEVLTSRCDPARHPFNGYRHYRTYRGWNVTVWRQ
jgi:hypothetical protein